MFRASVAIVADEALLEGERHRDPRGDGLDEPEIGRRQGRRARGLDGDHQHLIMAPHTTEHWPNELFLPSPIVDRDNREAWLRAGGKDIAERATDARARRMFSAQRPPEA